MVQAAEINGQVHVLPDDINAYWSGRMHDDLYRLTVELARGMFGDARSAIDVGVVKQSHPARKARPRS